MRPTNAQILEGRDEALEHLGISLVDWEVSGPDSRRHFLRYSTHDELDLAATQTVVEATAFPAGASERNVWINFLVSLADEVKRRTP